MRKDVAGNERVEFFWISQRKSALMIFGKQLEYKKKGGGRHFRTKGYYVDTVGRNEEQILKYIKKQSLSSWRYDKCIRSS